MFHLSLRGELILKGFGVGPLFWAPLSELYGRIIIYHISGFLFVLCTVACALSTNLNMLIVFRFLAGSKSSESQLFV
jgi:MFS family permease